MTPDTDTPVDDPHEFDRRMRCALQAATPIGDIPASLFRRNRRHVLRSALLIGAGLVAGMAAGTVYLLRPPALVQEAISHERHERTVRGNFMPPHTVIASFFGLPPSEQLPGLLQLAKPCHIADRLAYHMTTWLDGVEGGGMVTAITFAQPVDLPERSGWWPDAFWRVVQTSQGMPVLLIAQNRKAIDAAVKHFR